MFGQNLVDFRLRPESEYRLPEARTVQPNAFPFVGVEFDRVIAFGLIEVDTLAVLFDEEVDELAGFLCEFVGLSLCGVVDRCSISGVRAEPEKRQSDVVFVAFLVDILAVC